MDKYKNFSVNDFLDDPDFMRWMTDPSREDDAFWNEFVNLYPSKKDHLQEARLIFRLLHTPEVKLPLSEQYELWNSIQSESKISVRQIIFKVSKYAAIFIFTFLLGAVSFYYYQDSPLVVHNNLSGSEWSKDSVNDQMRAGSLLVLADGTKVPLVRQLSTIVYSGDGDKLIVNQDTISQLLPAKSNLFNKLSIPYGKKSILVLSDGTKIWLNAGSQISYPATFSGNVRKVLLKGEAFFAVAKNANMPFVVETCDQSIHVLGTKFNISAYPEDLFVQTVLQEGKIRIEFREDKILGKKHSIEMEPNQMIELDKSSKEIYRSVVDASKFVSWRDDILEFNKVELPIALKQIERFYDIQIIMTDPAIATYKLSGKLDLKENPEEVLNIIKLTVPISWQKSDKKFKLTIK